MTNEHEKRPQEAGAGDEQGKGTKRRALFEAVETAAAAYFAACRKVARTINRLKNSG